MLKLKYTLYYRLYGSMIWTEKTFYTLRGAKKYANNLLTATWIIERNGKIILTKDN